MVLCYGLISLTMLAQTQQANEGGKNYVAHVRAPALQYQRSSRKEADLHFRSSKRSSQQVCDTYLALDVVELFGTDPSMPKPLC